MRPVSALAGILAATAMLSARQSVSSPVMPDESLSAESIYEACLQENLAVSIDWEAIKQQCRDRAATPGSLLPSADE